MMPTRRSAVAILRTNMLNGVLKFLLGSFIITKQLRKLPGNVIRARIKEIVADVNDSCTGAKTVEHSSGPPNFIVISEGDKKWSLE